MKEAAGQSSEWVLKTFLSRSSLEKRGALERYLSPSEEALFKTMPSPIAGEEKEGEPLLGRVHWSWLLPLLKPYTPNEQQCFLSALPPHERENLSRELELPENVDKVEPLSRVSQEFF